MTIQTNLCAGLLSVSTILIAIVSGAASASQPATQVAPVVAPSNTTGSVAPAPQPAPAAPSTQLAQKAQPEKICRTQTSLGSRLGKRRVCRTPAEWELMRRDAQQAIDARQRMNSAGRSKGDGG